jgi:hypothetical protein
MSDEECKCQDYDNERYEEEVCSKCKGFGGYPRCPECLNVTPKTSPPPDYEGVVKVLEYVASNYEYRAKIYGKQSGAECGNLAWHEKSKAEVCRAAVRALAPYLPKRCGWRGMGGSEGCVLPLGHEGGHGFSDGSGFRHNS